MFELKLFYASGGGYVEALSDGAGLSDASLLMVLEFGSAALKNMGCFLFIFFI